MAGLPMIQTEGLTKRFGDLTAVDGLTLSVSEGEILVLLGPNGAGKTTTVRMLASILRPTSGWGRVAGHDIVAEAETVRRLMGLLTEFPGLYLRMRALDYLDFFGQLYGMSPRRREERAEELLRHFGLWEDRNLHLGEFSKGMRQKLALIRALLHDPPVLFLDEPTSAMDPQSAKLVRDTILELRRRGKTILVCTHNLAEAEILADRIAIISRGKLIALGTPAELRTHFLGEPLLELRLASPLDGLLSLADDLVRVEDHGSTWLRYRTAAPEAVNPLLLERLTRRGARVVTVSEVPRSLEEVYLRIVEGEPGEA